MHIKLLWYGNNFIKWCTLNNNISVPAVNSLKLLELRNIALQMDLHFNSLTYLQPDIFPESLKTLDLSYNFLASPDPAAFQKRFHCDSGLEDFLTWLNGTKVTFPDPGVVEFSCDFPSNLHGVSLLNYSTVISCEEDDEGLVQELRLSLFVVCSALIVLIIVGMIVLDRLREYFFKVYKKVIARILEGPRKNPLADGPPYNAYLCFSNNDYKWVETALLKRLDSQLAELLLRGQKREDHLSNIRDAIWGSRKTVCIVSKEFLKDGWCLEA
ncbi:unnamed protein product [Coregonus sp. 'balchen']|nr:unnamed protein product [Coregonus sp. 'balchen']